MLQNVTCAQLCTSHDPTGSIANFLSHRISESYALNWLIDGLPAAEVKRDDKSGETFYSMGFKLGQAVEKAIPEDQDRGDLDYEMRLNNHYEIYLDYHRNPASGKLRVVGVFVWPRR